MSIKEKIKPTAVIVGLFVLGIIALFASEDAHGHVDADNPHSVSLSLGGGVVHYPSGVTQGLAYEYDRRWAAEYERLGGKGYETVHSYSVSRVVWQGSHGRGFNLSIGATYTDGTLEERDRPGKEIVSDDLTFRLGVGYAWELSPVSSLRLGVVHNSTAGRSERNRGIDRVRLTFNWKLN